jgi:hypothetical protein
MAWRLNDIFQVLKAGDAHHTHTLYRKHEIKDYHLTVSTVPPDRPPSHGVSSACGRRRPADIGHLQICRLIGREQHTVNIHPYWRISRVITSLRNKKFICYERGEQILQKCRGHLKILGARWVTCRKSHTASPQILDDIVQNWVILSAGVCAFPRCEMLHVASESLERS